MEFIALDSKEVISTCLVPGVINDLAFTQDDQYLIVASGWAAAGKRLHCELLRISLSTFEIVDRITTQSPVYRIAVSQDGKKIAFGTRGESPTEAAYYQVVDAATFKPTNSWRGDMGCADLRFDSDSKALVCAQWDSSNLGTKPGPLFQIDVSTGKRLPIKARIRRGRPANACILPDGRVVTDYKRLVVYELGTGKVRKLKARASPMPSGDLFYVAKRDNLISSIHSIRNASIPETTLQVTSLTTGDTIGTVELVDKVTARRAAITERGTTVYFGGNKTVHVVRIRYQQIPNLP